MADKVLLLGDPRLRASCEKVDDARDPLARADFGRPKAALDAFRAIDRESVVCRAPFAADPDYFRALIDYVIPA